jgi:hypothetical protein
MRTQEEIQRQIKGLEDLKATLPEYSAFGDNNHEQIETQIGMLMGINDYDDFVNEEDNIESAAYLCKEWMEGNSDEDLF